MEKFNFTADEYYSGDFEIARQGYWEYDTYGYVVLVRDNDAAIVHASHCSCYGTWDQGETPLDWTGTVDELVELARSKGDPDMLGRELKETDYGADYLLAVYRDILVWDAKGRVKK